MAKKIILNVQDMEIAVLSGREKDFFSLTDIARRVNAENPAAIIINWLRTKDTIEFLGAWEVLYNPSFNLIEFDKVKNAAGTNRFILSVSKWVEATGAIGIQTKAGRYGGGTFAHKDIALEFCSWVSPVFKLYLVKEFERLKAEEAKLRQESQDWSLKRTLARVNYRIHTEAVREYAIPPRLVYTKGEGVYFASEADMLNLALFGMTAREWRLANPERKGNMRDYASAEQLLVLSNIENLNAEFLRQGVPEHERLSRLNEVAIYQLELLLDIPAVRKLDEGGVGEKE